MPEVTFLISVSLDDISPESLALEAEDIADGARARGSDVISVVPWARPTLGASAPAGGFTSLTATPPPNAPIA